MHSLRKRQQIRPYKCVLQKPSILHPVSMATIKCTNISVILYSKGLSTFIYPTCLRSFSIESVLEKCPECAVLFS